MFKAILDKIWPIIAPVAIACLILYQHSKISKLENQIEDLKVQQELSITGVSDLLQEEQVFRVSVDRSMLQLVGRIDSIRVQVSSLYIPPEGSYSVIVERDTTYIPVIDSLWTEIYKAVMTNDTTLVAALQNQIKYLYSAMYTTKVDSRTRGFCFVPAIGVGVNENGDFTADLGSRFLFYNRFGAGASVGTTPFTETNDFRVDGFIDYRIPKLDNLAPKIYGGYNFTDSDWEIGAGVDFLLR